MKLNSNELFWIVFLIIFCFVYLQGLPFGAHDWVLIEKIWMSKKKEKVRKVLISQENKKHCFIVCDTLHDLVSFVQF